MCVNISKILFNLKTMSLSVNVDSKFKEVESQLTDELTHVHLLTGSDVIKKKADSLNGLLGNATSNVESISGAAYIQSFEGGCIIATQVDDAHVFEIHGDIYKKWNELGREKFGLPITDETGTPDGVGRYNHFNNGSASIYWHPSTGAHAIYGAIRELWANIGWEASPLGYPTSDEITAPDNVGRMNNFQHGTIYWPSNNTTGAYILPDSHNWTDTIVTGGLAALGGNYELIFYRNGNFVFKGHMHDSGSDNYDAQLAVAIVDTLGTAYTMEYKGHTSGTWSSGSRDDDWEKKGFNATIAKNWGQMRFASYARVFNYNSAISTAVGDAVTEAVKKLVAAGIDAGVKAVVSLV